MDGRITTRDGEGEIKSVWTSNGNGRNEGERNCGYNARY